MRLLTRCLTVVLLVLAAASTGSAQADWRALRLGDAREALAYFPGEASASYDTLATATGERVVATYAYRDGGERGANATGNLFYAVTVVDYGPGAFPADSLALHAAFFDATVAAAAERVGGRVVVDEDQEHPTAPGRYFRLDVEDPERGRQLWYARAYLVGGRYFVQQQVVTTAAMDGERARLRFFDSGRPLVAAMARRG